MCLSVCKTFDLNHFKTDNRIGWKLPNSNIPGAASQINNLLFTQYYHMCRINMVYTKNEFYSSLWLKFSLSVVILARMRFGPKPFLVIRGRFHILFCALRPTFEKLFKGVERALRRAPNFNRAISIICALRPTFMKSTPGLGLFQYGFKCYSFTQNKLEWFDLNSLLNIFP